MFILCSSNRGASSAALSMSDLIYYQTPSALSVYSMCVLTIFLLSLAGEYRSLVDGTGSESIFICCLYIVF